MENWDINIINEYRALNYLSPFTDDAQAYRDGLLLQFTFNQNITKRKDMKMYSDLLPYLKEEPEWLEHSLVKKAKQFIELSSTPEMLADTLTKIQEQIQEEESREEKDSYLIHKLKDLYNKHKR
ncbi:hypothetical protein UF28_16350 [Vibrio parahaemolyticus]|nr:hypothetical protein UF28_16350 [Vibrio parahaemolyticus]